MKITYAQIMAAATQARFWSKVQKSDGCWLRVCRACTRDNAARYRARRRTERQSA